MFGNKLVLCWVLLLIFLHQTMGEDITVNWYRNPANSSNPVTPLRINASRNDTLVFVYNRPVHTVYWAGSRQAQLKCAGVELCGPDQSPCVVPLNNITDENRIWFFCVVHCPNQNLVVRLPAVSPTSSPSSAPSGAPSTAPSVGPTVSPGPPTVNPPNPPAP